MKVAIDISQIVYGTGVSVYTKELLRHLNKNPQIEMIPFAGALRRSAEFEKYNAKVLPIPPKVADFLWNKLHILPIEALVGKIDLIHTSDWSEPPSKLPKVTTIHDLAPILYPSETNPYIVQVHKRRLEHVKRESSAIIVPSESTKNDLVKLGFNSDKIFVIYEALASNFEAFKRKSLKQKYLLAVGTAKRKNIERIAQAFNAVKKDLELDELIVVGEIPQSVAPGVNYVGKVTDRELASLYANAEALVYASLYEGFGFPILEAFASNCPVVTSNLSSMPEVAGDAAIFVDPKSVDSIAKGIKKAIRSKKLLVKNGVKQLAKFSWVENAKQTVEVYKKII